MKSRFSSVSLCLYLNRSLSRRQSRPPSDSCAAEQSVIDVTPLPALITPAMPDQVLEQSLADVSVLVGLLVDKFCYHLPIYRQHQRMSQAGITLSRATLTNWVKRTIALLHGSAIASSITEQGVGDG